MTKAKEFRNPGFGRRKTLPHNKGRQLDIGALNDVESLLKGASFQRDMLIEYLHIIQDKYGHLSARHMMALAHLMKLSQAEIFEVASFYAHFDIVLEGEAPPPATTVRVCDSLSCSLYQSEQMIETLQKKADAGKIRILRAPCMGRCHQAPVAEIGHRHITHATIGKIFDAIENNDVHPVIPDYISFDDYQKTGGYQLLRDILASPDALEAAILAMEQSNLRGLGGAGFPTGRKWRLVRQEAAPRLMAVNGDEGEPGTIKDHHYLTRDPHRFLEGMLIAAHAVEAEAVYIYMRDEYPDVISLLKKEIALLEDNNLSPHTKIILRRGAGAYICGEESAMIESIEGKRGLPRHRPPFVAQKGIFDRPTLVNNVETLFWVRDIVEKGGDWFQSHGRNDRTGLRSFSVSGRVKNPGVKLAPAGITISQLIDEYCDGMQEGHEFKAYLPGGASGGILPASLSDIPLDFDTLHDYGCFIGSAAVVVLSDHDNISDVALNLMKFFEDESCGQCTPCRVGTEKAVKLMCAKKWDKELLAELSRGMMDASICGLGQAAPNPLLSLLKYFPGDVPK